MSNNGRVVTIADIGGHLDYLEYILEKDVQLTPKGTIPKNTHLVVNGDIVHKGPDSEACLDRVVELQNQNGSQVTLTAGNHEEHYLGDIPFWRQEIDEEHQALLRDLWAENRMVAGVAIQSVNSAQYLVTHAGVTPGYWKQVLACPITPVEAAARLAAIKRLAPELLWYPGCMITGAPDGSAGPLWASCSDELYPGWAQAQIKGQIAPRDFHQIHGHSTPYDWQQRKWRLDGGLRDLVDLNFAKNRSVTTITGNRFIGIDPGFSSRTTPQEKWSSFIVRGEVVPTVPKLVDGMRKLFV